MRRTSLDERIDELAKQERGISRAAMIAGGFFLTTILYATVLAPIIHTLF